MEDVAPRTRYTMAEFLLPKNSKISGKGRVHKARDGAKRTKAFKIYRYDPDSGANPRYDSFEVDLGQLRTDGPRRADQDQGRAGFVADLPALVP